eukprot:6552474-Prymnesium_polylepis.1
MLIFRLTAGRMPRASRLLWHRRGLAHDRYADYATTRARGRAPARAPDVPEEALRVQVLSGKASGKLRT